MSNAQAIRSADVSSITGHNKAKRIAAVQNIASLSLAFAQSRDACVANLVTAIGQNPDKALIENVLRTEHIIGRVALRCDGDLALARIVTCDYASLPKDATTSPGLPKGKTGWRTVEQARAYQAGKEHFSKLLADVAERVDPATRAKLQTLGFAKAETIAIKNDKASGKRGARPEGNAPTTPDAPEPPKVQDLNPATPDTAETAVSYAKTAGATLRAYANKHAKLIPGELAEMFLRFDREVQTFAANWETARAQAARASMEKVTSTKDEMVAKGKAILSRKIKRAA